MKITLINPPFQEQYAVGASRSIKYVLNIIPPLGLAYLAVVLEKSGFQVRIVDFTVEDNFESALAGIVNDSPHIVGITAATATFESAQSLADKLKKQLPQSIIVMGGAHVTAMPYEAMAHRCFDVGVLGEGEETFLELSRHIQRKGALGLREIKGIILREEGKLIVTAKRDFIANLDSIPYPARHLLLPLTRYRPTPASYRKLPLGIMITSRGCPHQCTFCDRAVFGNIYRSRSSQNVLGEADELINKYGAKEIRFFDDCFTLDKNRALAICSGLKKYKIPWTCLTCVDSVDKELLKEMKSAGCWQILFGLESGDERMLSLLQKGMSSAQNIQAIRWAKDAGLSVRADFIVGTPGETEESLKKTLNFALRHRLNYAHFNKFVPYPGTELYKMLKDKGYEFDFSKGASITDHSSFLYTPDTLKDKIFYKNFVNYAHKRFYLRPGYILKRILSLKTWDEFFGQVKGFFSVAQLK